jgi:T-complex protein 1 subunit theta
LVSFGDSAPGLDQYAIKKYAEAFEVIPRTLSENAGLNALEIISSLYAAHQAGKVSAGIDVDEGQIIDVEEHSILDLLQTKLNAVRLATNAAITILRVDQVCILFFIIFFVSNDSNDHFSFF